MPRARRRRLTPTACMAGLLAAACLAMLSATTAAATPPSGASGTILAETTVGSTEYILREVTIAPGGTTGWHYHDGTLYAAVREGTLTHYDSTCHVDGIYNPGNAFIEPAGPNHVHLGRNQGATPLVLDVLYVLPAGDPLSEDAPNPGCSQS